MKKMIVLMAVLALSLMLTSCSGDNPEDGAEGFEGVRVAVSIVPQERFVREVGGDLVDVIAMIPSGASPANYQPTPRQMQKLSDAELYFSIGVASERANIIPKLHDMNEDIRLVSLEEEVARVYPVLMLQDHHHEDEDHDVEEHDDEEQHDEEHNDENREEDMEEADPHIWLSPKRTILMVEIIRDSLIEMDGENEDEYRANAETYLDELRVLDNSMEEAFRGLENKAFIIYHPSYGYLADDYGLEMVTVEEGGKGATVDRLKDIIDFARERDIRVVFYQDEFDSSQAETIAKEIEGTAVEVSPLSYEYIESMEDILEKLQPVLK